MAQRADTWAMRLLFEMHGAKTLRSYQQLPYFQLNGKADDFWERYQHHSSSGYSLEHTPFEDFALSVGNEAVIRILSGNYHETVRGFHFRNPVFVETWIRGLALPLACVVDRFDLFNRFALVPRHMNNAEYKEAAEQDLTTSLVCIAELVRELEQSEKHLVEVIPSIGGRRSKTKKPWTREDLPRFILLSSDEAKKYGHNADHGGSHAPPRIHQRRGHWRHLASERFLEQRRVWVRPAWVGEREWGYQGNHYRVVTGEAA